MTAIAPVGPSRRERWEARADWPLTIAALAFLVAYAWPIVDPTLDQPWRDVCRTVSLVTWLLFVGDYLLRLALSRTRKRFVVTHLLDLAVVRLPLLRPLRLLVLVRALGVLNRAAGSSLRGRVAVYVVGAAGLVVLVASLAVLDAERGHPGANIETFRDAVWWSFTTVMTVGYGDRFPVTDAGRVVAVALMVSGIALLGVVTASIASWLLERVAEAEEESQAATRRDVHLLSEQVRRPPQRDRAAARPRAHVG